MPDTGLSRRGFLAAAGGAIVAGTLLAGDDPLLTRLLADGTKPSRQLWLRRRQDQLSLRFDLYNLDVSQSDTGPVLRQLQRGSAFLVVVFPPQTLAERAFWEGGADNQPPRWSDVPVPARLAQESRLAYDLTEMPGLPVTTAALLSWAGWMPSLVVNAQPRVPYGLPPNPAPGAPVEPKPHQTALEVPFRLILSPHEREGWAHSVEPVEHGLWTELWHTRLANRVRPPGPDSEWRVVESDTADLTVRAVWAEFPGALPSAANDTADLQPGAPYPPADPAKAKRSALTPHARYDLVRLSSDFTPYKDPTDNRWPDPIDVRRLMMSSLGAWIDVHGVWEARQKADGWLSALESWRHRGTMGRDHYVVTVERGVTAEGGHGAAWITVTERKFERTADQPGSRGAQLRKRTFIMFRQPVREYPESLDLPANTPRRFPFRKVRVVTLVSPDLDAKTEFVAGGDAWVPSVGGQPVRFHFRGTDWAGRDVDYSCPVVFIADSNKGLRDAGYVTKVVAEFEKQAVNLPSWRANCQGRRIVVAPQQAAGDTAITVTELAIGGVVANADSFDAVVERGEAPFYPYARRIYAELPEIRALSGKSLAGPAFTYADAYVNSGFGGTANPGEVFLARDDTAPAVDLRFRADSAGGVVTPDIQIGGLSRKRGPIAGKAGDAAMEKFDPKAMFGALDASILGGVRLADVLAPLNGAANPGQAVTITRRELSGPDRVEVRMEWHPALAGNAVFVAHDKQGLSVVATSVVYLDPNRPGTFSIHGELRNFDVKLFGNLQHFLTLTVDHLRFTAAKDAKTDLDVKVKSVAFEGALKFLAKLATLCKFGDGSGLTITVDPDGITVGFGFTVPDLSIGMFALRHIAVSAGVDIPFDGTAALVRFGFASREHRFQIAVMCVSGGGFVSLVLGSDRVHELEFSLEFGGSFGLDAGIASGSVELMGGVDYLLESRGVDGSFEQECTLTAYLRLHGEVDVLGIVSVSVEFYLSLQYRSADDSLYGEARMTVSIDVAFFSKDVTIRVRKRLAGGGSAGKTAKSATALAVPEPVAAVNFGDQYPAASQWQEYCAAFAPTGA